MTQTREIHLPADLCATVESKYAAEFAGLEELLVFILSELAADEAMKSDREERQIVEEQLRQLGYI